VINDKTNLIIGLRLRPVLLTNKPNNRTGNVDIKNNRRIDVHACLGAVNIGQQNIKNKKLISIIILALSFNLIIVCSENLYIEVIRASMASQNLVN
jgi:hypothetical protein